MSLTPEIVENLMELSNKIMESAAPLLFLGTRENWPIARGVAKGLKRVKRNLQILSDSELLSMSEEEYNDTVSQYDLIITIEVYGDKEKISYFPLDAKNSGAYVVSQYSVPNEYMKNFDVYIVTDLPGLFPHLINMMEKWRPDKDA